MIKLQAPYPTIQTTSVLPNPAFSNAESAQQTLAVQLCQEAGAKEAHLHPHLDTPESRRVEGIHWGLLPGVDSADGP